LAFEPLTKFIPEIPDWVAVPPVEPEAPFAVSTIPPEENTESAPTALAFVKEYVVPKFALLIKLRPTFAPPPPPTPPLAFVFDAGPAAPFAPAPIIVTQQPEHPGGTGSPEMSVFSTVNGLKTIEVEACNVPPPERSAGIKRLGAAVAERNPPPESAAGIGTMGCMIAPKAPAAAKLPAIKYFS
jgi:hypothetical protein